MFIFASKKFFKRFANCQFCYDQKHLNSLEIMCSLKVWPILAMELSNSATFFGLGGSLAILCLLYKLESLDFFLSSEISFAHLYFSYKIIHSTQVFKRILREVHKVISYESISSLSVVNVTYLFLIFPPFLDYLF